MNYAVTIYRCGEKDPLYKGEHIFLASTQSNGIIRLEFARAIRKLGYEGKSEDFERDFRFVIKRLNAKFDYPPASAFRHCPDCGKSAKDLDLDNEDFKVCGFCGKPTRYLIFELVRFCQTCQVSARFYGLTNEEFRFCGDCGGETSFAILKREGEK